ncbi:hypothetical protein ABZ646_03020 [Streptomyces sp. NPDC007162]|uniref:hypothetical protein n=1 Tax=Streptomyces sp. NPDC007162 TaxID=3156917 RepID=UPI0033CFF56A
MLAERVGWASDLVSGLVSDVLAAHWNSTDVDVLASGQDAGGRKLPSNAMALRRLGWATAAPEGVQVNDRLVRMAQEQAGRTLRSAKWRADLTSGVLATWPADPGRRTPEEWDAVRAAVPGGQHLPGSVIKSRTRHIAAFEREHGRLPGDVFEAEAVPRAARMLLLSACDGQQATIERGDDPARALLRLQLPTCPDPRSYRDWTWVSCPIALPPAIPAHAVLHLPTLRLHQGVVRADVAYTHAVPKAQRSGHRVALGVDWGLNTLLSAGAAHLHDDGRITALGTGAQFRAAGVLAKQHRLRRLSECLHAKADHYRRLIGEVSDHQTGPTRRRSTRPAPRRRRVPSPTSPSGPEGHVPSGRMRLPRAAHRHQGVTTISTPTTGLRPGRPPYGRHRPRGAALGAGFHLHAHASPPRWETIPDTTSDTGSFG